MTIHSAPKPSKFRVTLRHLRARGQRFIEPAASIQDLGTRRQVQLQTVLVLVLMTLILVAAIVTTPLQTQGMRVQTLGLFGVVVLLSIAYGLSRTRYYEWGAILAVTLLSLVGFLTALANPAGASTIIYAFVPIAFVLGSFLLRTRFAAALVVIDTLFIFCLPLIIGGSFAFRQAASEAGALLTLGILLIVFSIVRNLTEQDRLAVLAKANQDLQTLRETLEQRVADRTAQLQASAEVGRAAVSILDTNQLLREIVNLIPDHFGFYYTAVFLADRTNKWAVLGEATGEAGRILKGRKHRLEIGGQSMVGSVMETHKARIALDVGDEAVRFANPLLPDTRSEIALPLMVGSRVLGALDVQSTQVAAFDEASAAVLQSMADQIAIALSNTILFQQTQTGLQRTRQLYEASTAISNAEDTSGILRELMPKAVPDAAAAQILTYGPLDEIGRYAYLEVAASWAHSGSELLLPVGTRIGSDQVPPVPALASEPYLICDAADPAISPEQQQIMQAMRMRAMLGYALVAGSQPVGLLLIVYREPRVFMAAETQPLQALAGQVAVTLRNQQLVREEAAAVQQLDEINRRLTHQAWNEYARTSGAVTYKEDAGPTANASSETAPAVLATPITIHGEAVGVLRLEDAAPDRKWTPNELALARAVAGEVAIALENARLIEETQRRAQRERLVAEVSSRMFAANDLETIVQIAGQELGRVLRVDRAEIKIDPNLAAVPLSAVAQPGGNGQSDDRQA